jgi:hypothetical protein
VSYGARGQIQGWCHSPTPCLEWLWRCRLYSSQIGSCVPSQIVDFKQQHAEHVSLEKDAAKELACVHALDAGILANAN